MSSAPGVTASDWLSPYPPPRSLTLDQEALGVYQCAYYLGVHVEDGVPWSLLAIVVRRRGSHLGGLLRALDDGGIPRFAPERGVSLLAEPATYPFVLALRWIARPGQRDALIEPVLASELARLAPAEARGLVREARARGDAAGRALEHAGTLPPEQSAAVRALHEVLAEAERTGRGSVLDTFGVL